jgi:alkanesulfonate monooxygenase SsuD/methylene tetrahydromethanopterin reductase-like flavin-dependent oxidoreductase (luciferase family)
MERGIDGSISYLKNISDVVNDTGYESILLVYHSKIDDNWIKASRALDLSHKFKYMPAIRTYAISPEYCAMICRAFSTIAPDRLMLNIVSGDIHQEETSIDDLIWIKDKIDTPEKRLKYTDDWLSKFIDLSNGTVSEIVMAGHSNDTRLMAEKYNATHLSMLNMQKQTYYDSRFLKNSKQMVSLSVIINDSFEEINKLLSTNKGSDQWTVCGNKKQVKEQIYSLKDLGVTDILINSHPDDKNIPLIHSVVKEMIEEQNGIK